MSDKEPQFMGELDQEEIDRFVAGVGTQVRRARNNRRLSRRELSERSGVSQRYLALLETGGGNISIVLLYKVAAALSYDLDWFLSNDSIDQLMQKVRRADPAARKKIEAILDDDDRALKKSGRICLIGLRGAGKSTIGKSLGKALEMPFVELNEEIEKLSGLSVAEVMDLYGQEGYRKLERQSIEKIIRTADSVVVAAAGGIVSDGETYQLLLKSFNTVWLKATAEQHMQRVVEQGDQRPMAGHPQAMADLKSILNSREESYSLADIMIDTSGQSIAKTGQEVLAFAKTTLSL